MTEATAKPNYKKTLNLPKTGFPMRANLAQNEPASLKRWEGMKLYDRIVETQRSTEPFVFHDGPPYANGSIHLGHMLNKVLKDLVVRSRNLVHQRRCAYVPGWDCHGLPIEHKVMTELMESGKAQKITDLPDGQRHMAIRRACAKDALKYQKLQTVQMKRLLTLADYDHPYLTLEPRYEQGVLEVFADLCERGVVYRDLKPVHWSIANQTALAEAELEYEDREDLSVYVDFEAADRDAVAQAFGAALEETPSFMIWTTTPWTLPANLAIAVHERFRYSLVRVDGNITVIASDLVRKVTQAAGSTAVETIAEADGAKLVGLRYRHPFCDRTGPVVQADYVTLEDGTGLVHTAPGHGADDYHTGQREGLDIYCPVLDDGTFDDTVPEWLQGLSVWDANGKVTEHLRASGHLYHDHTFTHSYPHDWRSRTPVIFRATKQWFIGVNQPLAGRDGSLRDLALEAADADIRFIPEWGRNRMRGMLESRPDWCLSRQRSWGLPIPAFKIADGSVFMTAASVRAVAKVIGARGSDAWFTEPPEKLLEHYDPSTDPDAPEFLKTDSRQPIADSLEKMYDIFDVWFESGSSWHAVMRQRDLGYPIDLYLEGSDQHRGWFQASLLPALGMTGRSPYRSVLTHGFMVDKDGKKMSKSLGNTLDVEDLLKDFGADVSRWWVSSLSYEGDIKVDLAFFETAGETYRKVRNTLRFMLSNLANFDGAAPRTSADLAATSIDGYVLAEAASIYRQVFEAYDQYAFRRANQLLYDFCNETLSAFYCAAVKDRLYCDKPDSPRRRATQGVMWQVLELLCRLLAPIMPHTADEAYRAMHGDESCVHLAEPLSVGFEADPSWPHVLNVRAEALKALEEAKTRGIENPLDAEVVLPDPDGTLARFTADLADLLGVSRVALASDGAVTVNDLGTEPRCERSWKRDGTVKQRSDGGMLSDRDADAVGVA